MGDPTDPAEAALLAEHTYELELLDGARVLVRPVLPGDRDELEDGFSRLSRESRYFRFFSHIDHLTEQQLRYLTELDYHDHFAVAAFALDEPARPGVAVARYVRPRSDHAEAELAVAVMDDHHGRGIGVGLIRLLSTIAAEHGVERFVADVLRDNVAMRDVFRFLGARTSAAEPGVIRVELDLPVGPMSDDAPTSSIRRVDPPRR